MHKLSRSLFAGFVAMGALVACDDVDTTPPAPQVSAVNVVPQNVQLSVGQTATLTATVVGDAGLENRSVTWTSSNNAVATVDAAGVVRAVAPGQTTIIARSAADNNVTGAASVVVTPNAVPALSIASITKNGLPVDINNVQGQVDVTLNVAGNGASVGRVDLLAQCPNNTTPVVVQSQTFSGGQAPNGPITLSFNSARVNTAGTGVDFTNGPCNIVARLFNPAGQQITEVGDVVRPITLQNVDVVQTTITSTAGPTADDVGQPWRGGDVTVRVLPLLYSGQTANAVTVTLSGTDNDGTPFSRSQTVTGTFPQNVTFIGAPGTTPSATNIAGWTVPNVVVTTTAANASTIVIPTPATPNTFNLDTEAPAAGAYAFNTQGTGNNWIGNNFVFNTTTGNGYAATVPAGFPDNDWNGVDRVAVTFQAANVNTNTQTCSAAQSGLTFATVTGGSSLNSSQVNGISPNGPSYCLRLVETDALGNSRTTVIATPFGVDRENPRFIREGSGSVANNSSFDQNSIDEIPTDAFPVAGTAAMAPAAYYAFTLRDTLSGFDATPVNYTITRAFPSLSGASTCIVGTFASSTCSPTDGLLQAIVIDSTDRTVRIPVTGGSVLEGYFTFNGTFRDQAANAGASALPTRTVLVDNTAPAVSRVGLPGTLIAGNSTAAFNFDATDNIDLYMATASLRYGTLATIRSAQQQIGTPFDATFTTSLTNQTVNFANFYRSLTASPAAAGVKPDQLGVRVWDAATNMSAINARAIDPQDVQSSTFTFGGAGTQLQSFQIVTAVSAGETSPTCVEGVACTVTVRAMGPSGTFENPFAAGGVNLYMQDPVTAELVLLSLTPNNAGAQTDNGVNRFYTYTFNVTTPSFAVNPAAWTLFAIGFNGSGDAILSAPLPVNVINAP